MRKQLLNVWKWLHDAYGVYDPNILQQLNALLSFGIGKMKRCTVKVVSFIISSHSRWCGHIGNSVVKLAIETGLRIKYFCNSDKCFAFSDSAMSSILRIRYNHIYCLCRPTSHLLCWTRNNWVVLWLVSGSYWVWPVRKGLRPLGFLLIT